MRFFTQAVRPLRTPGQSVWVVLLTWGLLSGEALGQTYTGLHDANSVYGIPHFDFSPWTNDDIIALLGQGATDPNFTNVSFSAYGIYSFASLTNLAAIDVNGVGGNAFGIVGAVSASVQASVQAYGIFAETEGPADVDNSGNITVTASGGTAESSVGNADAHAWAFGIFVNGNVTNT